MTDKEIVERAKEAGKKTDFCELVNSPISKGVNSAYGIGFIEGMVEYRNSLQEENVSGLDNGNMPIERWKQAVKAASNQRNYRSSKGLTETKDDYFVDGVQWADEHPKEKPASKIIIEGTNFNKSWYAHPELAFKAGAKWQITKLVEEAGKHEVKVDAGGYPYIPQIELYDYDKDIPLAKEGDKYNVILIKED